MKAIKILMQFPSTLHNSSNTLIAVSVHKHLVLSIIWKLQKKMKQSSKEMSIRKYKTSNNLIMNKNINHSKHKNNKHNKSSLNKHNYKKNIN